MQNDSNERQRGSPQPILDKYYTRLYSIDLPRAPSRAHSLLPPRPNTTEPVMKLPIIRPPPNPSNKLVVPREVKAHLQAVKHDRAFQKAFYGRLESYETEKMNARKQNKNIIRENVAAAKTCTSAERLVKFQQAIAVLDDRTQAAKCTKHERARIEGSAKEEVWAKKMRRAQDLEEAVLVERQQRREALLALSLVAAASRMFRIKDRVQKSVKLRCMRGKLWRGVSKVVDDPENGRNRAATEIQRVIKTLLLNSRWERRVEAVKSIADFMYAFEKQGTMKRSISQLIKKIRFAQEYIRRWITMQRTRRQQMMDQWDAWEYQRKRKIDKSLAGHRGKVVSNESKYSYAYNVPPEVKQGIIADKLREKRLAYLQSLSQWKEAMEIHHQKWEMQKSILNARAVITGITEAASGNAMQLFKNDQAPNKGKPPQYESGFTAAEIKSIAISFQHAQKLKEDEAQENDEIAARLFQQSTTPGGRRTSSVDVVRTEPQHQVVLTEPQHQVVSVKAVNLAGHVSESNAAHFSDGYRRHKHQ
ncbi:hypothetical protein CYMTET_5160 [Cymbomonas tetramitiformis]|uniref:Uncharacterized protein n=1 Tax=Cymbomonas tetramitiformis TaxID=36881 RepID=A0AAE0GZX2_9CHLO|nr:hypothetical protein CYMTET_5160 [Cymbomonas tetramitiformis]